MRYQSVNGRFHESTVVGNRELDWKVDVMKTFSEEMRGEKGLASGGRSMRSSTHHSHPCRPISALVYRLLPLPEIDAAAYHWQRRIFAAFWFCFRLSATVR